MHIDDVLIKALRCHGIEPPIKTTNSNGYLRWGKDSRYFAKKFNDGNGWNFGNWTSGLNEVCFIDNEKISPEEIALRKQAVERQRAITREVQAKSREEASNRANKILSDAASATNEHSYLRRKKVFSYGLKQDGKNLLIPLYDTNKKICSIQFIDENGKKIFLPDGKKRGCYFPIGRPKKKIFICEGYATGASIHLATGEAVAIAFDAGNIKPVVEAIKQKYPHFELIIAADNDHSKEKNIGIEKAREAALSIGCGFVFPNFNGTDSKSSNTDFNDLLVLKGSDEVRKQLANIKEVKGDLINKEAESKPSQASKIIDLVKDSELFHDEQNVAYVTIDNNGHQETWCLDSSDLQNWISHNFWKAYKKGISKNTLQDAIGILKGMACFDGACKEVHTRVAMIDEEIYINLANENWEVVKVTKDGWTILKACPIKFTRFSNMQPLPTPCRLAVIGSNVAVVGSNIAALWRYINISEKYRKLILAYMLECFRTNTPFLLLVFYGTQGSAKSTTQEIIRMLIDPSVSNLRAAPKKSEDILVAAANNWMVSYNNISHLSDAQQDDLCSVATGGALSGRALYTNHQETSVNIKRPVMINGIGDLITAQDLIDRCIVVELPEIEPENRKTEQEIMLEFSKEYAAIFGSLLDILAQTLKELPNVKLQKKPRMADFAILGTALEKVMGWETGSFMDDYLCNRTESMASALEHSPVAIALMQFIENNHWYDGSYARLYDLLSLKHKPEMASWVKSPKGLANQIMRQKLALRSVGVEVTLDKQRHKDGFHVHIQRIESNVHQVHQVHQALPDKGVDGELMGEHAKFNFLSTPQVHPETPH
jgi:phage/plasmid primase-like uncharacterized protein